MLFIQVGTRIKSVDGLRAICVLGVIWIHCWTFCGNPAFVLFGIDFYKIIALLGNGVDFFFVISGFFMYMVAFGKVNNFFQYLRFIKKRWLRLAPAYYLAICIYGIFIWIDNSDFDLIYQSFFHFLFLNNIVTGNTVAGIFWSLGTEWHFYMLIPIIFFASIRFGFYKVNILLMLASLFLGSLMYKGVIEFDNWQTQVLIRFPEFAWGVIAAEIYKTRAKLPNLLYKYSGLLLGLLLAYIGRTLKYTPLLEAAENYAWLLRTLADPIMTLGFSVILLSVLISENKITLMLKSDPIVYLGKISFSMYLWHALAIGFISDVVSSNGNFFLAPIPFFLFVCLLTILMAHFSYRFLEAPYFKLKSYE
jgi:peptidoglycan/LPS O-acetylase OafA/YrhL